MKGEKNSGAKTKCADCFGYEVTEGHWACAFPLCVKEYDYDPITRSWLPKLNVPEEYQPYPNISCDRRDEKYEKPDNREPKEAETLTEYMIRVDDVGVRKSEERKAGIPEVEYQFSNYEPKEERTCETCKYRTVHGNEEVCSNCNINWRL